MKKEDSKLFEEKIDNIVKNIFNSLPHIFVYLPFFLVFGILYQFINLVVIDKLVYFSWTQVINDTVSLFFPIIFGIIGIIIGINIEEEKIKKFLIDSILNSLVIFVLSLVLYGYNLKLLYMPLSVGFISVFLWKFFIIMKIYTGSEKMKFKNHRNILKFLFIIISLIGVFNVIISLNYKELYIEFNQKNEKVIYFNDKYIILKDKVIKNTDNIVFNY